MIGVGDLVVSIGPTGKPGSWSEKFPGGRKKAHRVDHIIAQDDWVALIFHGMPSSHWTGGWCAESFRKIQRDKREACESEFVKLLNRTRKEVSA